MVGRGRCCFLKQNRVGLVADACAIPLRVSRPVLCIFRMMFFAPLPCLKMGVRSAFFLSCTLGCVFPMLVLGRLLLFFADVPLAVHKAHSFVYVSFRLPYDEHNSCRECSTECCCVCVFLRGVSCDVMLKAVAAVEPELRELLCVLLDADLRFDLTSCSSKHPHFVGGAVAAILHEVQRGVSCVRYDTYIPACIL